MGRVIKIFDTTLRDGEQSPGCSMNLSEKIEVAKQLESMKVDIIEAGFAIASKGDSQAIEQIAKTVKNSTICSLARCAQKDIDEAWKTIKYAKLYCPDIEFLAEDACRSDLDFLCKVFETAIKLGELIEANIDLALANDITGPVAIREMEKAGFKNVYDKDKIALVMDHFAPNKDIKSAQQCLECREFAKKHNITHFYDVGQMGIEHALLPEKGLTASGELIIGADSHTCTYGALGAFSTGVGSIDLAAGMATGKAWFKVPYAIKFELVGEKAPWVSGKDIILYIIGKIGVDGALYRSMEFTGEGVSQLSMDDRFSICNMAIEAGAKNGIFPVDDKTLEYMNGRVNREFCVYEADNDAEYDEVYTINLSELQPTVAVSTFTRKHKICK